MASISRRINAPFCRILSSMYLGHKVDAKGLHPLPSKIRAVKDASKPRNVSKRRAFLGLLSYYHKFIPNLSILVHPLNTLLQKNKKWQWSGESETAFNNCKLAMTKTTVQKLCIMTWPC